MPQGEISGKVILAGAGPGDAELITLKLQRCLQEADVIITDRLVNPLIIESNARKDAEIIFAGKQGYNDASYKQAEVTSFIIGQAIKGKLVLRLKGGDVAFFSNVLDELEAMVSNNIPFEIIPGITAASGVSAYAGIPLTGRNISQGVQFLVYNPERNYSPERWSVLAQTSDTLIFYMAARNICVLSGILLQYGKSPETPIAIVEQATTPYQRVNISALANCTKDFSEKEFSSPSLVIIGEVVSLHQSYKWFKAGKEGSLFRKMIR